MNKLIVVLLVCLSVSALDEGHGSDKLTVTLFYESYCPGCIDWLGNQLLPGWNMFKTKLLLELVPFGNAKQWYADGHFKFVCQHGPLECLANKLHACAILQACGKGGTISCGSPDALGHVIKFIHCIESQPDQELATPKCATAEKLQAEDIIKCAKNTVGDELLSFYGNRTTDFKPKIRYVPTVAINGKHNKIAEDNLVTEICRLRPSWCNQINLKTNIIY